MKLKKLNDTTYEDVYGIEHTVENFDLENLTPEEHGELYQEGPFIKCELHGDRHATRLSPGKMLIMEEGKYAVVDAPMS